MNTSGRAVIFAGATVAVAMLGLILLDVNFLTGVGIAAAITVALAVAAATTLLPALFGVLGLRILGRRERRRLADGPTESSEALRAVGQVGGLRRNAARCCSAWAPSR